MLESKRNRVIVDHAVRRDPVLPRDIIVCRNQQMRRDDVPEHDDDDGRERCMAILDVNGDGLAVETLERPKNEFIRVVDKYEFLILFSRKSWPKQSQIKLTSGQKRMK